MRARRGESNFRVEIQVIRKREGNWSRSLCLAHLRRYLCEALGFSSWEKARNSKTLGEMKQSFVTRLENSDPKMCLLASLEVIRRIFELDVKRCAVRSHLDFQMKNI